MKTKPGVRKQRTRERTIIKKKKNLYSPSFHHLSNSVGEMIHLKVMPKQFLFPMIFFFLEKQPRKCWVGNFKAFISLGSTLLFFDLYFSRG